MQRCTEVMRGRFTPAHQKESPVSRWMTADVPYPEDETEDDGEFDDEEGDEDDEDEDDEDEEEGTWHVHAIVR